MIKVVRKKKSVLLQEAPANFEKLVAAVQPVFTKKLNRSIEFNYIDIDGDQITISNDFDYQNTLPLFNEMKRPVELTIRCPSENQPSEESIENLSDSGKEKQASKQPNQVEDSKQACLLEDKTFILDQSMKVIDHCEQCCMCKNQLAGVRYSCVVCPEVELCEACEAKPPFHQHPLVKLRGRLEDKFEIQVNKSCMNSSKFIDESFLRETVPDVLQPVKGKLLASMVSLTNDGRFSVLTEETVPIEVRLKNKGDVDWPDSCNLQCLEGFAKGHTKLLERAVKPGEEIKILLYLNAPARVGEFVVAYRLYCPNNKQFFGQKIAFSFTVKSGDVDNKDGSRIICNNIMKGAASDKPVNLDFIPKKKEENEQKRQYPIPQIRKEMNEEETPDGWPPQSQMQQIIANSCQSYSVRK